MGRIKPAALLLQSKKKKAPARFSTTAIAACIVVVIMFFLSIAYTHKHRGKRLDALPLPLEPGDATWIEPEQGNGSSRYAILNTTLGLITLELFDKLAPKVVEDFVTHSQNGFYDGGMFHRVVKGFMIQGGALEANGTGEGLISDGDNGDELPSGAKLEPYTLTMEILGPGHTHGSQFFITTVGTSHLSKKHTIFGSVVRGRSVVQDIENLHTDSSDRPLTPVLIHNVIIKDSL